MTGLLAALVPDGVAWADIVDEGQRVVSHPDEMALISGSAEKRRREFTLGRDCVRAALVRLGAAPAIIARDPQGAPVWPAGIVGSITHTAGYAAALVARAQDWLGVGIDAERIGGVTQKIEHRIFDVAEQAWLAAQEDRALCATILFSAKEAFFKAQAGGSFSFRAIHVDVRDGGFIADDGRGVANGRYVRDGDLVVTCVCRATAR